MSQRTRSFGVLALVLWGLGAWAQPTYLLRPHREVPIGISVAGMGAFNLWAAPAVKGFTLAELDALEPTHIPAWDQWALGRWNEGAGHRSDYLFYGAALWSSATVLLPALNEGEWQASLPTAVMWVEMNALTLVATDLTKNLVTRPRPFYLLLRCSDGGPAGGGCAQVLFFGAYQHDGRQYLLCSQGFFRPLH